MANPLYTIDTNSLVHAWHRLYPLDVFPGVWDMLEDLAKRQVLISAEEVLLELERKDDGIHKWAKKQKDMFIPPDEKIQNAVKTVLKTHPTLVDQTKSRSGADPFVIAIGIVSSCTVVTEEKRIEQPGKRPRIPEVCDAHNVRCISLLELLREQGGVFRK